MSLLLISILVRGILLAALTLAIVLLLRRFAPRYISAAGRHMVCATGIFGILLLPLCIWSLPAWNVTLPFLSPIDNSSSSAAAATTLVNAAPAAVAPIAPPVNPDTVGNTVAASASPANDTPPVTPVTPNHVSETISVQPSLGGVIAALYLAVTLAFLIRVVWGYAAALRLPVRPVASDTPVMDLAVQGALRIGLAQMPHLYESPQAIVPQTLGGRKSARIILPSSAVYDWSEERLRTALLHEMGHIRRGDYLWQLLADFVVALNWANPFVWILAARLRDEAERAADDIALVRGDIAPSLYADHLLVLVRDLKRPVALPGAVAMARRSEIGARITALLRPDEARTERFSRPVALPALVGAVGVTLALALLNARPKQSVAAETVASTTVAPAAASATAAVAAVGAPESYRQTLTDGTTVELLTVTQGPTWKYKETSWWRPDGTVTSDRPYKLTNNYKMGDRPEQPLSQYEVAFRVTGPRADYGKFARTYDWLTPHHSSGIWSGVPVPSGGYDEKTTVITGEFDKKWEVAVLRVGVAKKEWHDLETLSTGFISATTTTSGLYQSIKPVSLSFLKLHSTPEGAVITISHEQFNGKDGSEPVDYRYLGLFKDGKQTVGHIRSSAQTGDTIIEEVLFPGIKPGVIRQLRMEGRAYDWVTFPNIALRSQGSAHVVKP